jgi:hypothetical protein
MNLIGSPPALPSNETDRVDRAVEAASERAAADQHPDPIILALAQLVRDRWRAERAQAETSLALRARPSNMRSVDEGCGAPLERSA